MQTITTNYKNILQTMEEIWKFYKETYAPRWGKRIYYVSDQGNVMINNKLVKFDTNKKGYYGIARDLLHRVVAKLFIPNPENKPCVDHINGDRHDNRAVNLRWCTYIENNNNPITNTRQSEAAKNRFKDPKQRQIISESVKNLWEDKDYRDNMLSFKHEAGLKAWNTRRNKILYY